MPTHTRTALLSHALIGYEERKAEITEAIARLRSTLQATTPVPSEAKPRRKHGIMSPAARKRMALMMKQRWAKVKRAGKKRLG
ncbi:MAG TPA: hypothetical protein VN777_07300 [Terriglobales bacterium]|nr:hypothetical protein [Terriglobales bacterium]HZW92619.1 hypothetical protein [Candidatus Eremiobacteraceae bacterium]